MPKQRGEQVHLDSETFSVRGKREKGEQSVRGELDTFLKNPSLNDEDKQALRRQFAQDVARGILREKTLIDHKQPIDIRTKAAIVDRALGRLETRTEDLLGNKERGKERLNPNLLSKQQARKEFERDLRYIRDKQNGDVLVLVSIDLDEFKSLNDHYGHPAGDAVLKQVGNALADSVRPEDGPAHYSGDEFGIILRMYFPANRTKDDIDKNVQAVLTRIISKVEAGVTRPDGQPQGLSVGYRAVAREEHGDFDEFLSEADTGVEASKLRALSAEKHGKRVPSAERVVDFNKAKQALDDLSEKDRAILRALRGIKRELSTLEETVPSLKGVDTRKVALKLLEDLVGKETA